MERRFAECGLELHPEKTKVVYRKDRDRTGDHPVTSFDVLGYTFRARRSKNWKGKYFVNFSPGREWEGHESHSPRSAGMEAAVS